jgi:hypothetical protein
MFSSTSWILFGVIVLAIVVAIWKWWKKPVSEPKKNDDIAPTEMQMISEESPGPPETLSEAPPMVFAVNDQGNLDLEDISGKILNISYGPNPKTYIWLLDKAEKDTEKIESETGVTFTTKVGNTKLYDVVGRSYIINYTRLT